MTDSVIERVARALAWQHITRAHRQLYGAADPSDVQREVNKAWPHHVDDARAALTELRTPSRKR